MQTARLVMANFSKGDRIKRVFPRSNKIERGVILDKYYGPNDTEYYHISWESGVIEMRIASAADIDLDFDLPYGASNAIDKCTHKWKTYVGFTESYEYCEICDKKK